MTLLRGGSVDRPPVMPLIMMRAADHSGVRYLDYVRDAEIHAAVQIRASEDFGLDHVSCISDPAREASDCGAQLRYFDDQPPALDEDNSLLSDKAGLAGLKIPGPWEGPRMRKGLETLRLLQKRTHGAKAVEGWVEGPCAEAADLRGLNRLMLDFYDDPEFVRALLEFVTELEIRFASAQAEAGADYIGIGDAACSLIGPSLHREFILPYQKKLVEGVHALGLPVRLHICGNIQALLPALAELSCDMVDLDFLTPLDQAREKLGPKAVLAGNLDPVRSLRDGNPEMIRTLIKSCAVSAGPRYAAAPGCEIPRGTPVENILALAIVDECRTRGLCGCPTPPTN